MSGASWIPSPCYPDAFVTGGDRIGGGGGSRRGEEIEGKLSRIFIVGNR